MRADNHYLVSSLLTRVPHSCLVSDNGAYKMWLGLCL